MENLESRGGRPPRAPAARDATVQPPSGGAAPPNLPRQLKNRGKHSICWGGSFACASSITSGARSSAGGELSKSGWVPPRHQNVTQNNGKPYVYLQFGTASQSGRHASQSAPKPRETRHVGVGTKLIVHSSEVDDKMFM